MGDSQEVDVRLINVYAVAYSDSDRPEKARGLIVKVGIGVRAMILEMDDLLSSVLEEVLRGFEDPQEVPTSLLFLYGLILRHGVRIHVLME